MPQVRERHAKQPSQVLTADKPPQISVLTAQGVPQPVYCPCHRLVWWAPPMTDANQDQNLHVLILLLQLHLQWMLARF